jgi:hypothetical protein
MREEAAVLGHYCGIHKKAEYSKEALAALACSSSVGSAHP